MYLVLSLLVGLSDVLILLCVPLVGAALWLGRLRGAAARSESAWRTGLRWGGWLGAVVLGMCLLLLMNRGLAGRVDRLDYGLLTGVPTVFVALVSAYTIVLALVLAGFALARSAFKSVGR